eukprot:CAMPEP_0113533536 /NCGR_PEP_ID=MMETSP0015_2-20120614/4664_1 /TAXON_ID=2838 /ORGANISM="Odontella" /LENGTH=682 /DNA_ID=CAMNT_0000432609 /DNA_START=374 /DNA_END=2422 /DNA_ORIENTATION=+ /assembly_acc=CAM_ASM_000160
MRTEPPLEERRHRRRRDRRATPSPPGARRRLSPVGLLLLPLASFALALAFFAAAASGARMNPASAGGRGVAFVLSSAFRRTAPRSGRRSRSRSSSILLLASSSSSRRYHRSSSAVRSDSSPAAPSPPAAAARPLRGVVVANETGEGVGGTSSSATPLTLPLPTDEASSIAEIMSTPNKSLYERLVRRLYMTNLFHPVKMGLQNIEDLHRALKSPLDDPSITVIHIAGTNGKGSVALKTARSLELAGDGTRTRTNRVGLFASPHVSSFRERMSIDGIPITESEVEDLLPRVFEACETRDIPATYFEVTTALAFLYFKEGGCDAVVLETGLGGRLDATNVVSRPELCVITSIGLEHTRILGETIPEIAREKGGIIKAGRPVLVGPHCPHDVLRECAEERGAGGYHTCEDVLGTPEPVAADAEGGAEVVDYDLENARIATAALELLRKQTGAEREGGAESDLILPSPEQIRLGTSQRPSCRFEQVAVRLDEGGEPSLVKRDDVDDGAAITVVLDVAHNPDAMRYLVSKLEATYPSRPKRIVAGFSSDKDLRKCGDALLSVVGDDPSRLHLVEAAHPRAARLEDILDACPALRESNFEESDRSITAQVRSGLRMAAAEGESEVLVVCGSVFLMAEAREALGYDEPRDSEFIAEVAGCNLRHGQENFGNSDPEKKLSDAAAADGTRT